MSIKGIQKDSTTLKDNEILEHMVFLIYLYMLRSLTGSKILYSISLNVDSTSAELKWVFARVFLSSDGTNLQMNSTMADCNSKSETTVKTWLRYELTLARKNRQNLIFKQGFTIKSRFSTAWKKIKMFFYVNRNWGPEWTIKSNELGWIILGWLINNL